MAENDAESRPSTPPPSYETIWQMPFDSQRSMRYPPVETRPENFNLRAESIDTCLNGHANLESESISVATSGQRMRASSSTTSPVGNFLYIRRAPSVKGSWNINTSLYVPAHLRQSNKLLANDQFHFHVESFSGDIDAQVGLVGNERGSGRLVDNDNAESGRAFFRVLAHKGTITFNLTRSTPQLVRIVCLAFRRNIYVCLPRDFCGTIETISYHGRAVFSPRAAANLLPIYIDSETDRGNYFLARATLSANFNINALSRSRGNWTGDSLVAVSLARGMVYVYYEDETPELSSSDLPVGSPEQNEVAVVVPGNSLHIKDRAPIRGSWYIDTSLKIPKALLHPDPKQMDGANLHLESREGNIEGDVTLLDGTSSSAPAHLRLRAHRGDIHFRFLRASLQRIKVSCWTGEGDVKLYLPRSFHGAIKTSSIHGVLHLSEEIAPFLFTCFLDDETGIYFLGNLTAAPESSTSMSLDQERNEDSVIVAAARAIYLFYEDEHKTLSRSKKKAKNQVENRARPLEMPIVPEQVGHPPQSTQFQNRLDDPRGFWSRVFSWL